MAFVSSRFLRTTYRPVTAIDSRPMPPLTLASFGCALLGATLLAVGAGWMHVIGANMALGRRLAGAREIAVGDAARLTEPPSRPVRVSGRIRCPDPLVAPDGERLVAYHRDVEVRSATGGWRTIERLRETRSFELWDHAGSLYLDPTGAAEPLITIPLVWEGQPDELGDEHEPGVARVAREEGQPVAARAVTRTISEVDRLLAGRSHEVIEYASAAQHLLEEGHDVREALMKRQHVLICGLAEVRSQSVDERMRHFVRKDEPVER